MDQNKGKYQFRVPVMSDNNVMFWEWAEVFIPLAWRGWEVDMVMMNLITCMQNTCTFWTEWNIRNWKCPLLCAHCLQQWHCSSCLCSVFPAKKNIFYLVHDICNCMKAIGELIDCLFIGNLFVFKLLNGFCIYLWK